jgi:hypothetical protein
MFDSDYKTSKNESMKFAMTPGISVKRINDEVTESDEYTKLVHRSKAKTSKSKHRDNKLSNRENNTRNLLKVVRNTAVNIESNKSRMKKYVVKRKLKKLKSELNQE